MRAHMAHFQAKIVVFGTLDHQKLILPFKNFVLPLFDPKIGPKK